MLNGLRAVTTKIHGYMMAIKALLSFDDGNWLGDVEDNVVVFKLIEK